MILHLMKHYCYKIIENLREFEEETQKKVSRHAVVIIDYEIEGDRPNAKNY